MVVTSAQTQKILTTAVAFRQLGFSMLVTRLRGRYKKDTSPDTLRGCTDEINSFLKKYSSVMADDYDAISKL